MKLMNKFLVVTSVAATAVVINACSSSSGGGAATTNEFSSLPEVTGPVTTNGSLGIGSLATTGVVFSNPGTFSSGMSVQMCENVNLLKEIFREASQPDKILCYMAAMKSSGVIPSSLNIADGDVKYVRLVNLPAEMKPLRSQRNSTPIVKFQIQKTNGAISSFKMYSCFSGTSGSPIQSEYISQTFSGGTATVVAKNTGSEGAAEYGSEMTATGSFTTSWETKNISGQRYYSESGQSNKMTIDMNQFSDLIQMSIAMKGRFGADTFTNRFYTVAQLIGSTPATFALGDGSSKVNMSFDQNSGGPVEFTDVSTYSWNGDTRLNLGTASNGDYYTSANSGSVPADPGAASAITFTGEEAWDCTVPSGATLVEADFNDGGTAIQTGMNSCNSKYGEGGSWISCPYM